MLFIYTIVKIFCFIYKDFVDILLKYSQNIEKAVKYNLVLKVFLLDLENHFQFIILPNFHLIIYICQILGNLFCLAKLKKIFLLIKTNINFLL